MRIGIVSLVSACFILLVASVPAAHAGLFGYSELGIIKKSSNTFLFIAPDGDTVDEESLRYAIGRTAKILGFTHFIFEPVFDKPKSNSKASNNGNTKTEPVADEPKPVTKVVVYFYKSTRTRNGVKSIPLSDIDPDHIESAPVVEEAKPEPKKKKEEATKQDVTPVAEPAPVVAIQKPAPKKKKEAAPQEAAPVIEHAPVVQAAEPAPKKKKKEAAPQEAAPVIEPAPVVQAAEPAPNKKKKEAAPKEAAPVIEPAPVVQAAEPAPVVAADKPASQKAKPRTRRYLLPGDVEQLPEGRARVQDLGDLFN